MCSNNPYLTSKTMQSYKFIFLKIIQHNGKMKLNLLISKKVKSQVLQQLTGLNPSA